MSKYSHVVCVFDKSEGREYYLDRDGTRHTNPDHAELMSYSQAVEMANAIGGNAIAESMDDMIEAQNDTDCYAD